MEALACGTPVIAFRVGALPDIVEHGTTGFLVERSPVRVVRLDGASVITKSATGQACGRRRLP
jgi:glycosyltransferase involved in cell wall biosynthesis